jgi:hypothetical protein
MSKNTLFKKRKLQALLFKELTSSNVKEIQSHIKSEGFDDMPLQIFIYIYIHIYIYIYICIYIYTIRQAES